VEQNVGNGGDFRWTVEPVPTLAFATRDAARDGALEACRRLEPKHPFSEQRRRIFRITPDEYLVTVDGLTTTFHFRVSVAQELG
jgi:sarcosine oxidase gamma subunit